MWAHDIDPPAYADRLARHRGRRSPARTVVGGRWHDRGGRLAASRRWRSTPARSCSASRRRATRPRRRVVMGGRDVLSSVVSSQVDLHAQFGGVVPEIASRAHLELLIPVVARADRRGRHRRRAASTPSPPRSARGSSARCSSGWPAAKALALAWDVPFVGRQPPRGPPLRRLPRGARPRAARSSCCWCPAATRCSSRWSGHGRYRLLGQTIDDAAGEAFDKVARFLGLGYPGGPAIDRDRRARRPDRHRLPPGDARTTGSTSRFSGLKTAVVNHVRKHPDVAHRRRGRQLPAGGRRRARHQGAAGGRARSAPRAWCSAAAWPPTRCCASSSLDACDARRAARPSCPARSMCTDNAAMIAATGWYRLRSDGPTPAGHGRGAQPAPAALAVTGHGTLDGVAR